MKNNDFDNEFVQAIKDASPEQLIRVGGRIRTHKLDKKHNLARALREEKDGNFSTNHKRVS